MTKINNNVCKILGKAPGSRRMLGTYMATAAVLRQRRLKCSSGMPDAQGPSRLKNGRLESILGGLCHRGREAELRLAEAASGNSGLVFPELLWSAPFPVL